MIELDGPAGVDLRPSRSVSWVGSKIIYYMCMPAASIYIKYKFVVYTYKKCRVGGLESGRLLSLESVQAGWLRKGLAVGVLARCIRVVPFVHDMSVLGVGSFSLVLSRSLQNGIWVGANCRGARGGWGLCAGGGCGLSAVVAELPSAILGLGGLV